MLLSWINKFSLVDFPGKSCCIIFTLWCDLRCSYCHNPDFVLPEKIQKLRKNLISERAFFHFLEKRKWLLEGVSICGWEPTLQSDLWEFCKKIKQMWFSVKIDTNGMSPESIEELIKNNLVDYIAIDIKSSFDKYGKLTGKDFKKDSYLQTKEIVMASWVEYEFRTTFIKGVHSLDDVIDISKQLLWAENYYLQNYRPWDTLEKDFKGQSFTSDELQWFKKISEWYVKNVWIRM